VAFCAPQEERGGGTPFDLGGVAPTVMAPPLPTKSQARPSNLGARLSSFTHARTGSGSRARNLTLWFFVTVF